MRAQRVSLDCFVAAVLCGRVTAALDERIGRALTVATYLLRERRDSQAITVERAADLGGAEGIEPLTPCMPSR